SSVLDDIVSPSEGVVYPIDIAPSDHPAVSHSRFHLAVIDLDEARLTATLRLSGHHVCQGDCPWTDRVVLFSLGTDEAARAGVPPSVTVDLPSGQGLVTQQFQLPVRGNPTRYPFDTYELWLGIGLARVVPEGVQPLSRAEAAGELFLTVQEQLPRETMDPPV